MLRKGLGGAGASDGAFGARLRRGACVPDRRCAVLREPVEGFGAIASDPGSAPQLWCACLAFKTCAESCLGGAPSGAEASASALFAGAKLATAACLDAGHE